MSLKVGDKLRVLVDRPYVAGVAVGDVITIKTFYSENGFRATTERDGKSWSYPTTGLGKVFELYVSSLDTYLAFMEQCYKEYAEENKPKPKDIWVRVYSDGSYGFPLASYAEAVAYRHPLPVRVEHYRQVLDNEQDS